MKKTMLVLAVLAMATMIAAPAMAQVWSDNLNSYTVGTGLGSGAPNWTGGGVHDLITSDGGNLVANSNGLAAGNAVTAAGVVGNFSGSNLAYMQFTAKNPGTGTSPGNHTYVYMQDAAGGVMAYFYGGSTVLRARSLLGAYASYAIGAGSTHTFGILYNKTTGFATWYVDGAQLDSQSIGAGKVFGRIQVTDTNRAGTTDVFYLDNFQTGYNTPEPSSFMALGMFGLGALGFIKRRR